MEACSVMFFLIYEYFWEEAMPAKSKAQQMAAGAALAAKKGNLAADRLRGSLR